MVIDMVVTEERTAPVDMANDHLARTKLFPGSDTRSASIGGVRYEKNDPRPTGTALLLSCQYLRREVIAALRSHFPQGLKMKLDIMLGPNLEFRPTWTQIPVVPIQGQPLHLQVRIRLFNTATDYHYLRIASAFLNILQHFITYGTNQPKPRGSGTDFPHFWPKDEAHYPVSTLQVDVVCGELLPHSLQNVEARHATARVRRLIGDHFYQAIYEKLQQSMWRSSDASRTLNAHDLFFIEGIGTSNVTTESKSAWVDSMPKYSCSTVHMAASYPSDYCQAEVSLNFWNTKFEATLKKTLHNAVILNFDELSWPTVARLRELREILARDRINSRGEVVESVEVLLNDTRLLGALIARGCIAFGDNTPPTSDSLP